MPFDLKKGSFPVVGNTLEARTEDTMNPRVPGHVEGPTQHRYKRAVDAAVTQHMLLYKIIHCLCQSSKFWQWQRR